MLTFLSADHRSANLSNDRRTRESLEKQRQMGDECKGDDLLKKAEKKINGWGIFGSKYEDAAELFDKAANQYKLAKSCESAPILFIVFLPPLGFPFFSVYIWELLFSMN